MSYIPGDCKQLKNRWTHKHTKQWEKEAEVKGKRKKNIDADLLKVSLEKSYNNI